MPVIDTNLRFVKVPLDGDLSCLNFEFDLDDDNLNETPLTTKSYLDAYAQRRHSYLEAKDQEKRQHLLKCSLTEFVRGYSYKFKRSDTGANLLWFVDKKLLSRYVFLELCGPDRLLSSD